MGLGIKEPKWEWHQSLLTLRTPTEYSFLVSVFFCPSGLRLCLTQGGMFLPEHKTVIPLS